MANIDLILPCLNEEEALPWVLKNVPKNVNAIVVDNGSTDNSKEVALSFGAKVIECEKPGYGSACHAGLELVTSPIVAFCDCDATIDTSNINFFAKNIEEDKVDIAISRRIPKTFKAMSIFMRIANKELSRKIRKRTNYEIYDLGPFRIADTQKYIDLNIQDRRSGYPLEVILKANLHKLRLETFDIDYLARTGKSKVTGTFSGVIKAVKDMNKAFNNIENSL